MQPVPPNIIRHFANAFCFGRTGFAREEIPVYFSSYQNNIPPLHNEQGAPKSQVFADCVVSLSPSSQRLALYDLCDSPPPSKHPMPSTEDRKALLGLLLQADGSSPLGVELSSITIRGIREKWMTASSRLPSSPAGGITAARTLLETTCKTILVELGVSDDCGGDLGRLYKLTRQHLGIDPTAGVSQNIHQIANGLTQIIDGIAGLSNAAGDRHGLTGGDTIENLSTASLAVHAAGTVSLFLARTHRERMRGPV